MKRPWNKPTRRTAAGEQRFILGFRDHKGRERSRSFTTTKSRDRWVARYEEAERQNRLSEFLEGVDPAPRELTIEGLLLSWLALDADPTLPGGLAESTFHNSRSSASRHILGVIRDKKNKPVGRAPYAIGEMPAKEFEKPGPIRRWLDGMRAAGVSEATEKRAWSVLSSALSWAVERDDIPLEANGCKFLDRRRTQRRSSRSARGGAVGSGRKQDALASWALSPMAVELIRADMLAAECGRYPLVPLRNATYVSMQYELACRNQEVWPVSWHVVQEEHTEIDEVLSYKELDDGKTVGSHRNVPHSRLYLADLQDWRVELDRAGYPTGPWDFIFPGSITGHWRGHELGHMTGGQAKKWGAKYFKPAAEAVQKEHGDKLAIAAATPYSLRRGRISLRIRGGEDRQIIAQECGTSVAMIDRHYSFALEDLRRDGPRDADVEREAAREAVFGGVLLAA
jgi:integrase